MLKPTFSAVDMRVALSLGNLGLRFFWLQIASVVQFMTANVLISNFFSPAMVTPYTIAYRYFSLVLVAFTVVCMPFWSATTDAYERKDMQWIRQADRRMKVIMLAIAGILALMVVVSPYVYRLWVGDMCQVPFSITVMMAVYIFLLTLSTRYSYFINGVGTLRVQLYMTVMVIVFIPLAWYASYLTHDILYFMAVMCICIAPSVLVNKIQFSKLLKGTATGIWGK
jgi:O-antigen/teichoic acid export membrane protein